MSRCARCDFVTDDTPAREQMAEHARTSGHWCCDCGRSLTEHEPLTCEQCLSDARSTLAGILTLWDELPHHLGHVRGVAYDHDRHGGTEPALPGGDALVMLSPGGTGTTGRRLMRSELAAGLVHHLDGREHAPDNLDTDPPSIAFALMQWEDDWRHTRGEPAGTATGSQDHVLRAAAKYLDTHARWAANTHPAFSAFLAELRAMHARLERATGRDQRPVRAEAECFACGQDALVRLSRPAAPCEHRRPSQQLRPGESLADRDARLARWDAAHADCAQGGYEDRWTCGHCGETYDWRRYCRAVSERLRDSGGGWSLPGTVATLLGVPAKTVLTWVHRGQVATACLVTDRRIHVWFADAEQRANRRVEKEAS